MVDKRTFPRKRKRLLVDFFVDGQSRAGFTRDISFTGLFIASSSTPHIGEAIAANLHLPNGKKIECRGTVVRARHVPTALAQAEGNGFCVALSGYFEDYCRFLAEI